MKICKHCGMTEELVYIDVYELGGIGCAHDMIEIEYEEFRECLMNLSNK